MAPSPRNNSSGPGTGTAKKPEGGEGSGVSKVVGPVVALLQHEGAPGPLAIWKGLCQHLSGLSYVTQRDSRYLRGDIQLGELIVQNPLFIPLVISSVLAPGS